MTDNRGYYENVCLAIVVWLSVIAEAQTFINPKDDHVMTEYYDGYFWAYLEKDSFVVGVTCNKVKDDYGKYYRLDIYIRNLSRSPVTFFPDSVYSDLLTRSNDILRLEVYTNDEYQKKIRRSQAWAMALYGLSAGLNSGAAGYSTSYSTTYGPYGPYTTVTQHYDAGAAYRANVESTNQMMMMGEMMENDRAIREEGYLKTTTIYPDESVAGYMNVKRKKGKILLVGIPLGDTVYTFEWDVRKK